MFVMLTVPNPNVEMVLEHVQVLLVPEQIMDVKQIGSHPELEDQEFASKIAKFLIATLVIQLIILNALHAKAVSSCQVAHAQLAQQIVLHALPLQAAIHAKMERSTMQVIKLQLIHAKTIVLKLDKQMFNNAQEHVPELQQLLVLLLLLLPMFTHAPQDITIQQIMIMKKLVIQHAELVVLHVLVQPHAIAQLENSKIPPQLPIVVHLVVQMPLLAQVQLMMILARLDMVLLLLVLNASN